MGNQVPKKTGQEQVNKTAPTPESSEQDKAIKI